MSILLTRVTDYPSRHELREGQGIPGDGPSLQAVNDERLREAVKHVVVVLRGSREVFCCIVRNSQNWGGNIGLLRYHLKRLLNKNWWNWMLVGYLKILNLFFILRHVLLFLNRMTQGLFLSVLSPDLDDLKRSLNLRLLLWEDVLWINVISLFEAPLP